MRSRPLFQTEKLQKNLLLAFEIKYNKMICCLKPFSVRQFVKNFHLDFQSSVQYDHMRALPQFHAAM